jgi:hypothetical protein
VLLGIGTPENEPLLSSSDKHHPPSELICEAILAHNGGKSNRYFKIIATFAKFFFEKAQNNTARPTCS